MEHNRVAGNSRSALNSVCVLVLLLWTAWCLYWPFFARAQDIRQAINEADAGYAVCLTHRTVTPASCKADRDAYAQLLIRAVAPPDENAYQRFAGRRTADAVEFMTIVCFLPPVLLYAVLRTVLEATLWLARPKRLRVFSRTAAG